MRKSKLLSGEAALLVGGLAVIGLTLHYYPRFEITGPTNTRPKFSSAEADRQIEAAKSYLTDHPDDINTYVALSMAYYHKGPESYIEAMNALEKARSLGALSDHLFFYAGVMYDSLGLPDYAINELNKYLRHHPNDYESQVRLANLYYRQKRYDEALVLYKAALQEWPKDATAWFNYALVNKEKGNYPVALDCLEEVVEIAGQLPEGGLFEQGEIYRLMGDSAKALDFYQQELARQPASLPALEAMEKMIRTTDAKQARLLRKRISEVKKSQQQVPHG